ncbi:MAG: class I SAM-dependent methyltransferase [Chloroflexi bacterium]|nr:class I SAM-dependent methyltransferase [Chloroflexota bacterium]
MDSTDVPFYVELARQATGPIVELAVGSGRVAIPVAEAIRPNVLVGIDTSRSMLDLAGEKAEAHGVQLDLRLGDMRDFRIDSPAALIYCPRAMMLLHTWHDRRQAFERVTAALKPGGRFVWNAFVFDHRTATEQDGRHMDNPVPHIVRYAKADNRIDIVLDDGGETASIWWATKNEWLGLIEVAGLRLETLYGGYCG